MNKVVKMESPFGWKINENLVLDFDETQFNEVAVEEQPVVALINSIVISYIRFIKKDYDKARKAMEETLNILDQIDSREIEKEGKISIDVITHVANATQYNIYNKVNEETKAEERLKNLSNAEDFRSKIDAATIYGCKSIMWSIFHNATNQKAKKFIDLAILNSPQCPLWHFIKGKILRRIRRKESFDCTPNEEEKECFLKAYDLCKIPYYGIYIAQMYRENKEVHKANKIYLEIYNAKPDNDIIQLRLALAFTHMKKFHLAKLCFDYVEKRCAQNSMFLHYKGIYYHKQNNNSMAALFYNKAAKKKNFGADLQFAEVMMKMRNNFDYLEHLDMMLKKYEDHIPFKQQILLHIAMQHYYEKNDLENALTHFLKAIELNPNSKQLSNFRNVTVNWEYVNIYNFINDKLLVDLSQRYSEISSTMNDEMRKLENLCNKAAKGSLSDKLKNLKL